MSLLCLADDNLCCLCEKEISVRLSPCGHAIMCSDCASQAKRCPQCRVSSYLPIYVTVTSELTTIILITGTNTSKNKHIS